VWDWSLLSVELVSFESSFDTFQISAPVKLCDVAFCFFDTFLLTLALLSADEALRRTPGRKWRDIGAERPIAGTEVLHPALSCALQTKQEFSKEEWKVLNVRGVGSDCFVQVGERFMAVDETCVLLHDLNEVEAIVQKHTEAGQLEIPWGIDQVQWDEFVSPGGADGGGAGGAGGRKLKAGDHVAFLLRYDRLERRLAAIAIRKTLIGTAPPPASVLVLPCGASAYHELELRRKDAALRELAARTVEKQAADDANIAARLAARLAGGEGGGEKKGEEEEAWVGSQLVRRRWDLAAEHAARARDKEATAFERAYRGAPISAATSAGAQKMQKRSTHLTLFLLLLFFLLLFLVKAQHT